MTKWSRLNGPGREANERGRALERQFLGCYSTAPHRSGTLSIICTCPARWTDRMMPVPFWPWEPSVMPVAKYPVRRPKNPEALPTPGLERIWMPVL